MNAAALFLIICASFTSIKPATDLPVIQGVVSGKSCNANDGKCVAELIQEAQKAVKESRKAAKGK